MVSLREVIFKTIKERQVTAVILGDGDGIVSGAAAASGAVGELGLTLHSILEEGNAVKTGEEIARFTGTPRQIALAEESLIAFLAKPSGIASAARACAKAAGKKPKVVCGAWKKMPLQEQEAIRLAVSTGGALPYITADPFVYLDQNHIEMFGGIRQSIEAISHALEGETIVVQIQGRYASIIKEAIEAAECGAGIIFVDTGAQLDVMEVTYELDRAGLRKKVKVAFGGNVTLKDLRKLKGQDIDIVDMGSEIADAPLLDMRLEVTAVE
jgi:nicotinate-nucleotide pyrophosphorylase (carboxylating)